MLVGASCSHTASVGCVPVEERRQHAGTPAMARRPRVREAAQHAGHVAAGSETQEFGHTLGRTPGIGEQLGGPDEAPQREGRAGWTQRREGKRILQFAGAGRQRPSECIDRVGAHTGRPTAMEMMGLDLHKRETQVASKAEDGTITDCRIVTSREPSTESEWVSARIAELASRGRWPRSRSRSSPCTRRATHALEAYLGVVPCERSSGEKRQLGQITKIGNSRMRRLLVEAGWQVLRSKSAETATLRAWTRTIVQRRGERVAVVALARRLAGIAYAMWRDGVPEPAGAGNVGMGARGRGRSRPRWISRCRAWRRIPPRPVPCRTCVGASSIAGGQPRGCVRAMKSERSRRMLNAGSWCSHRGQIPSSKASRSRAIAASRRPSSAATRAR